MRPRENGFAKGDASPRAARVDPARRLRLLRGGRMGWLAKFCAPLLLFGSSLPQALSAPPAPLAPPANRNAAAKPTPTPAPTASPTPAPQNRAASGGERAVVFDPVPRPSAKDLHLTLESERKAEALAHYVRGLLLEESSGSDEALKEFLRAITLDPANAELALKLAGDYYLRRGEVPEAIDLLKDAIKASPHLPQPCLALSQIYLRYLHKPDQALKYAQMALDLDPKNAFAYQYLAETYVTLDQLPKAQALMDRAAKVESKEPAFWMRLANVYLALNFKDEKPRTPDDLRKASVFFQKAVQAAGNDPIVIEQAANFYQRTGQAAEALALFERAFWLDPQDTDLADRLAQSYRQSGQRDKAVAVLEQIVRINPNQESAYEELGEIYKDQKRFDKAADQYEKALRLNPNSPLLYQQLTQLLLGTELRQPERAVNVLIEARRRFPDTPIFGEWLGHALSRAKRHQEAMTVFEQTLNEARLNQEELLRSGQFYFDYGTAAEQAGLYEKAAELFRQALSVATDSDLIAETCNYLGYMWIDRNENLTEAEALVRRALEIQPESGAFLDSLGWFYFHTGKFDKALTYLLQAAAALKTEDPTVLEHIADTYDKLSNNAQALAYWTKAVSLEVATDADKERIGKKIADAKATVAHQTQKPPDGP